MIRITCLLLLTTTFLVACTSTPTPTGEIVVSTTCDLQPGKEVGVSLSGSYPDDATVIWKALRGSVTPNEGITVLYKAPSTTGTDIITAEITSGGRKYPYNKTCNIIPAQPSPTTQSQPLIPTDTSVIPTEEELSTPTPTSAALGAPIPPEASPTISATNYTIAVTEVMANSCGQGDPEKWNEYIELYNYGDQPIDVNGWWVSDNPGPDLPERIVAWNTRYQNMQIGNGTTTDSTIIPPGGFGLLLSPLYPFGEEPHKMPYRIPVGTVILTVAEGNRIGDEQDGLLDGRDVVVLFIGDQQQMSFVVSTYGTPIFNNNNLNPASIFDDQKDGIPVILGDCYSVERKISSGPDAEHNWQPNLNGSPGSGPYP